MELLERDGYLNELTNHYNEVEQGNGRTLFLMGEAGIGKTSVVSHFIKQIDDKAIIYAGACDSLFAPRPLGPLFDIAAQIGQDFYDLLRNEKDRSVIFATLIEALSKVTKPVVLLFEDVHWADEATLDLIKFLARRIYRFNCLFLVTYRDNEIHTRHPLATIFGELPPGHFFKVQLDRFSKEVVNHLAARKGYNSGEQLYALTSGNPFYVMEILASDNFQIPERVKDSILTVFHSKSDDTRALWEFLSILPSIRIELDIAKRIENDFAHCIDACIAAGVIVSRPGYLSFKHELFRLAIEESLSPSKRKSLHKKMLDILQAFPVDSSNLSRRVHHARYADERELVAKLAPLAAREAAAVGAHMEASKLYATAIEYTDKQDPTLVDLYERHAYECYLTNQIGAALASQQIAHDSWHARKVNLKEGDSLRFLSRLWWFAGDHAKAIVSALQSIEVLENGFPTRERAWAYSNLSQLHMLSDDIDKALYWGNKAIDLAKRMEDKEIVSHALNNVGTVLLKIPSSGMLGEEKLNQSLSIALENGFHEHAARAYVNLSSSFVLIRRYEKAMEVFDIGLKYCEERDLDGWKYYMLNCKARLLFETGKWEAAEKLAQRIQSNLDHRSIVNIDARVTLAKLAIRRGKFEDAVVLIHEAKAIAMPTHEAQRIIPVLTAELELSWITRSAIPLDDIRKAEKTLFPEKYNSWHYADLAYWMYKCGVAEMSNTTLELSRPFILEREGNWKAATELWEQEERPYEQALALFAGDERHQKLGLQMLDDLGAVATHDMLKSVLKLKGVKNIPRGPRESTRNNPAQLTDRQIDVLFLLKKGLQNAEIADKLFISAKTVDHHISAILSKLEVNTRTKAVNEASRLGILN